MARIAILGATGMLGYGVCRALEERHSLILFTRDPGKTDLLKKNLRRPTQHLFHTLDWDGTWKEYGAGFPQRKTPASLESFVEKIGTVDLVVNASGVIKPYSTVRPEMTLFINGVVPHLLSDLCGDKLVQITTDCVFDGLSGAPYSEEALHTPVDLYGLSKSMGEPKEKSLVLRTSIIGPELHSFVSLIEWIRKQAGTKVRGFSNHWWNGITTFQFGKIVEKIALHRSQFPQHGLFHVFSSDINKKDLVTLIARKLDVPLTVEDDPGPKCDRRLRSIHSLSNDLALPTTPEMISEL
jgi:dTDP-4-dehydrorhamnose reductase